MKIKMFDNPLFKINKADIGKIIGGADPSPTGGGSFSYGGSNGIPFTTVNYSSDTMYYNPDGSESHGAYHLCGNGADTNCEREA